MKKPRKAYKPKPIHSGGGLVALAKLHLRAEDSAVLPVSKQQHLAVFHWRAYESMRVGAGDYDAWETCCSALNIGMALCEAGIGAECIDAMVAGQEALVRAKVRADRHSVHRLDGDGLREVREALLFHDAQLEHAQRQEVIAAINLVRQRVAEGDVFQILSVQPPPEGISHA